MPPGAAPGTNRFSLATWLILRLLALVYAVAFASCWNQIDALVGPQGLMPADRLFAAAREQLGASAYHQFPSFVWFFGSAGFLQVLVAAGVGLSLLVFAGVAPALGLALLWAGYLSLCVAGQTFFNFQWDALLLETTLLAVFIAPWRALPLWQRPEPAPIARLLVVWLLFRLMFLSGLVKLTSGDPTWRDLSALTFHFETQPLPTVLGWWAHQLPAAWLRAACAGMFAIELVAPFCLFGPRGLRHRAAWLFIGLMLLIALTGNYTYFNFLTAALCVLCLDDAHLAALANRFRIPAASVSPVSDVSNVSQISSLPVPPRWLLLPLAVAIVALTFAQFVPAMLRQRPWPFVAPVADAVAPFRSFNTYGLFAVMTQPRRELVFEGSDDGRTWQAYTFPHQPGVLTRAPTWVAPHQPRLDWQLWFAALGSPQQNPWVLGLCEHLLRGNPVVLDLLAFNPFPAAPPRFVRVVRYDYRFTDPAARRATGQWWRRTPLEFYIAPVSLRTGAR